MKNQLKIDNVEYTFIDFETANVKKTSACQIALIKVKNGKIIKEYNSFLKPYPNIFTFSYIHGITEEHVKDAPTFKEVWNQISDFFNAENIILAHNAGFDINVLRSLISFYNIECKNFNYICTVNLFRKTNNYPNNKLKTIAILNNIIFNHHDACADVITLYKLINIHFSENYNLIDICYKNNVRIHKLFIS